MALTQLRSIRTFFVERDGQIDIVIDRTFDNLFAMLPEAMAMFPGDLEQHRRIFSNMLRKLIELTRTSHLWPISAQTGNASLPGLESIRARHDNHGISARHFKLMKVALLQALEQSFADDFTEEVRKAFLFVFDVVAKSLMRAPESLDEFDALQIFARTGGNDCCSSRTLSEVMGFSSEL